MRVPLPGSKHVLVEHSKAHDYIDLFIQDPPMKAHIEDGLFFVLVDSRKLAPDFMTKDEAMTKSLRHAHERCDDGFKDLMEGWVEGTLDCSQDRKAPEKGPKDWSPLQQKFSHRGKVTGHANTYNNDDSYWQGTVFEYVTFRLSGSGEQAMAVFWQLGGDPRGNYDAAEVWVGDVEGFLDMQLMDMENPNVLDELDEDFHGGLIWAVEKLGFLKADENGMPTKIQALIEDKPEVLSEEIRADIAAHPKKYASWVVDAVGSIE